MHLRFLLRQVLYDLETNLLFRPTALLIAHVILGLVLPPIERALVPKLPFLSSASKILQLEPGVAQTVMSTVAGSLMTVVSVVYSILLVALSLASIQFSTRILANFMRDKLSRTVLGLFVGAFGYCLLMLRAIRTDPPDVPVWSVTLGLVLTFSCLGSLVLFIHHIVRSIQANAIVDRIATETEEVIRAVFPAEAPPVDPVVAPRPLPHSVRAARSGYIQLIDIAGLISLCQDRSLQLARPMGSFVPAGAVLFHADQPIPPELAKRLLEQVDLGPERTLQDDAEYGFRQIVDIGLKAISPAVNDPSTGATCIDHLGRLLLLAASRQPPRRRYPTAAGALEIPNTSLIDLVDLSVEQLRQYGKADMAICLRLMRVLAELAPQVREPEALARIQHHAGLILENAAHHFCAADCEELRRRYAGVASALQAS